MTPKTLIVMMLVVTMTSRCSADEGFRRATKDIAWDDSAPFISMELVHGKRHASSGHRRLERAIDAEKALKLWNQFVESLPDTEPRLLLFHMPAGKGDSASMTFIVVWIPRAAEEWMKKNYRSLIDTFDRTRLVFLNSKKDGDQEWKEMLSKVNKKAYD